MKVHFITKCSVIALTIGLASASLNVNLLPNAYASSNQSQQSEETDPSRKIKAIIVDNLGIDDVNKIKDESSLTDDLGADSLDAVELVLTIEYEFDIKIPAKDAAKLLTVGDIEKYVVEKLN